MIKPAQLYEDKLNLVSISQWYDMDNIYYHGGPSSSEYSLCEDNETCHEFVSVNNNDEVVGLISYHIDWKAKRAFNFGLISFQKGNLIFIKDCYQVFRDIFEKYHLNGVEWLCYSDNPALRGYRNLVKKFNGREVGYFHDRVVLLDGQLHDCIMFEILASDYFKSASCEHLGSKIIKMSELNDFRNSLSSIRYQLYGYLEDGDLDICTHNKLLDVITELETNYDKMLR